MSWSSMSLFDILSVWTTSVDKSGPLLLVPARSVDRESVPASSADVVGAAGEGNFGVDEKLSVKFPMIDDVSLTVVILPVYSGVDAGARVVP